MLAAPILALLVALPGSSNRFGLSEPPPRIDGAVRVATYNLLNLFGEGTHDVVVEDARREELGMVATSDARCASIAEAIIALDADVVCVQELESLACLNWFNDRYLRDQRGDLLYPYTAAEDAGYYRDVEQGVLSRIPITGMRTFVGTDLTNIEQRGVGWDSVPGNVETVVFQRSPLLVEITEPGGWSLSLIVLHHKAGRGSDWHREHEALGVLKIVDALDRQDGDRNIAIVGDLNTAPWGKSLKVYLQAGFVDTLAHRSTNPKYDPDAYLYATHDDGRVLDYILLNPAAYGEFIPASGFVLGTHSPADYDYRTDEIPAGYASDHFPVAVSFLPKEGQGASIEAPPWSEASMAAAIAAVGPSEGGEEEAGDRSIAAEGAPFIASRRSEVFHVATCGSGQRIKDANKIGYAAATDALADGRRVASCCASAVDVPAAASEDAPGAFLASKSSKVFHEAGCSSGRRIKESNRIEYDSIAAAEADGKRPAGCCTPGTP